MTGFITSSWYHRVSSAISTACVFVTSLANGSHKSQLPQTIEHLLPWVVGLLQQLQGTCPSSTQSAILVESSLYTALDSLLTQTDPENDPELAQYGVEFAQKAMTKAPAVFLRLQPTSSLEYLFMFANTMLTGNEPLPKAAAAEFWVSNTSCSWLLLTDRTKDQLCYPEIRRTKHTIGDRQCYRSFGPHPCSHSDPEYWW